MELRPLIRGLCIAQTIRQLGTMFAILEEHNRRYVFMIIPIANFFPRSAIRRRQAFGFLVLMLFRFEAGGRFRFARSNPTIIIPRCRAQHFFLRVMRIRLFASFAIITFHNFFRTLRMDIGHFFIYPHHAMGALRRFIITITAPMDPYHFR